MNNKEFTAELSSRLGYTLKDTSELISFLTSEMTQCWQEGDAVSIQGFGTLEVKKKSRKDFCKSHNKVTHVDTAKTCFIL